MFLTHKTFNTQIIAFQSKVWVISFINYPLRPISLQAVSVFATAA